MFLWKKEFELGIESIDGQHRRLFEIGNRINELLKAHDDEDDDYYDILNVIYELKDYTVYHFRTEEELFLKYNYSEYESHKEEHDNFIEYLNLVDFEKINENQKAFLNELLGKIVNWVFKHIITTDFMYKDFLIRLGTK